MYWCHRVGKYHNSSILLSRLSGSVSMSINGTCSTAVAQETESRQCNHPSHDKGVTWTIVEQPTQFREENVDRNIEAKTDLSINSVHPVKRAYQRPNLSIAR